MAANRIAASVGALSSFHIYIFICGRLEHKRENTIVPDSRYDLYIYLRWFFPSPFSIFLSPFISTANLHGLMQMNGKKKCAAVVSLDLYLGLLHIAQAAIAIYCLLRIVQF